MQGQGRHQLGFGVPPAGPLAVTALLKTVGSVPSRCLGVSVGNAIDGCEVVEWRGRGCLGWW